MVFEAKQRLKKKCEVAKDLIDMISQSNLRLIREVTLVVKNFCTVHRPWKLVYGLPVDLMIQGKT